MKLCMLRLLSDELPECVKEQRQHYHRGGGGPKLNKFKLESK